VRPAFIHNTRKTSVTLASTLAEYAFGIVVRDLEGFGSRLNDKHRHALRRMLDVFRRGRLTPVEG
jgi:hypothetical protein